MTNATPQKKKETFEASLEKLEDIVRDLESGEKGLDDSLKLFEDGLLLSRGLTQKLEDVKKRVDVLTKEGKDKLKSRPLDEEGDEGA